jgi:SAM-dependent methyltransferase
MGLAWDTVERVNALARATGDAGAVLQFDNPGTQSQYRVPYAITASCVRKSDSVLDWGCGNGHFSLFLESLGASVTGYSFEASPRIMRSSGTFRFVPGDEKDPRSLPFDDNAFDVAVSMGVLEHVWETGGDEIASLRELARVVKPGGAILVFHFPNASGWIESAIRLAGVKKHLHGRRYSRGQIESLFVAAGIELVKADRYNMLPRAELRLLPRVIRRSSAFARLYNLVDDSLAAIAPALCTNFYAVGRVGA